MAAFLTRLPFTLGAGVGADADAWRLVLAGRMLADTGVYQASRPPSYPLVELVAATIAGAPWWVYPTVTAAVGAAGALAFGDLLRTLQVHPWPVPVAGYVLTPVIYRNDVTFMDFTWSLALLLGALALAARRAHLSAGLLLGLAIAARPSTAVLVVVVAALLVLERAPLATWARVFASAAVTTAAFFAVPAVSYGGLRFVFAYTAAVPWPVAAAHASSGVWGAFGTIAMAVAIISAAYRLLCSPPHLAPRQKQWLLASLAGIVATLAAFAALPLEAAYLAPVVPLTWLVLALTVPVAQLAGVAAVVALSSFVTLSPAPAFGRTVLHDHADRVTAARYADAVTDALRDQRPGTIVVAGTRMPQLLALQPRTVLSGAEFTLPDRRVGIAASVPLPDGPTLVYSVDDIAPGDRGAPRVHVRGVRDPASPELLVSNR